MKISTHKLQNGLRIVLTNTESIPSVTAMLLVGAGSRYENSKNNGVAHFFEHMAFKGSKKYPSAEKLATLIEGFGGIFNAFTSDDHTAYYVKGPAKSADTMIDVLGDMIQHPLLKQEEIDKEKGVIVQEINMYEDLPHRRIYEHFETLLYGGHPLGFDIIGSKDTVTSFTRKTFTDYIDQLYHPHNTVCIIAGGLTQNGRSLDDLKKVIEKKFSKWQQPKSTTKSSPVKEQQTEPKLALHKRESEQAHLVLGFRTFSRHDERKYALNVLMTILGIGMSSRLFREVREKRGLCYSVRSYQEYYEDVGYTAVYAGVEPKKGKVSEAMKVILQEMSDVKINGVKDEELKRAKEIIKGRTLLSLEDTYNMATMTGRRMLFFNDVKNVDDILENIDNVTADDVKAIAQEVFVASHLNAALIGPFDNPNHFQELLTIQ